MSDKSTSGVRLRTRTVKDESDKRVVEKEEPANGSVKGIKERTESLKNNKPEEEEVDKNKRDWETAFRIELDGISILLFVIAFITRTFRLSQPKDIVFDELHYGKYVGLYNKQTFFFDQHPPLGKQLIAAVTSLVGFGNYSFSRIGASYDEVRAIPQILLFLSNLESPFPECPNICNAICTCPVW